MSVITSKSQLRVAIACLLVIWLAAAATADLWLYGPQDSGTDSKTAFFTPILPSSAAAVLADGKRIRLNCFDELLKAAVIHGKILIVFARNFSAFLSDCEAEISRSADRTAIPTRAPPLLHSC